MKLHLIALITTMIGCMSVSGHAKPKESDTRKELLAKLDKLSDKEIKELTAQRIARLEEVLATSKDPEEIKGAKDRLKRIKSGKLSPKDLKHELQKGLSDDERTELRAEKIERLKVELKKAKGKKKKELEEKIEKLKGKIAGDDDDNE